MNTFTRYEVEDERVPGKTPEEDVRGVRTRLEGRDLTIGDIGTEKTAKFRLRAGDDRDAMIAGVQGVAARMAQFAIVEAPRTEGADTQEAYENPLEAQEMDPRLYVLKEQYNLLYENDRTYNGKVRTWAEVTKAIPDMPDFLEGVATLTEAKVCFLNEKGQLVIGDGCAEPPKATLELDYHKSRTAQTRISYLDNEGNLVVVNGDDTEIPADAKVLSEKGLPRLDEEYRRVNKGQFEKKNWVWTENGRGASVALSAVWDEDWVCSLERDSCHECNYLGSRGVLRVNLNF